MTTCFNVLTWLQNQFLPLAVKSWSWNWRRARTSVSNNSAAEDDGSCDNKYLTTAVRWNHPEGQVSFNGNLMEICALWRLGQRCRLAARRSRVRFLWTLHVLLGFSLGTSASSHSPNTWALAHLKLFVCLWGPAVNWQLDQTAAGEAVDRKRLDFLVVI